MKQLTELAKDEPQLAVRSRYTTKSPTDGATLVVKKTGSEFP